MGTQHQALKHFVVLGLVTAGFAMGRAVPAAAQGASGREPQKITVLVTQPSSSKNENIQAFEATVKSTAPTHRRVRVFDSAGQAYFSLKDLVALFDFAIQIEPTHAEGFFLSPQNVFTLNLSEHAVSVRGHHAVLSNDATRLVGQEIYVSSLMILDWFDISALIERDRHSIHFSTPNLLPSEARAARTRKRRAVLSTNDNEATSSTEHREIEGTTGAGYEIELYEKDKLIAYQDANAAGAYRFTNIPVAEGETSFRLALFGPQGQTEVRTQTVSVSPAPAQTATATKATAIKGSPPPPVVAKTAQPPASVSSANQGDAILAKNWKQFEARRGTVPAGAVDAYVARHGVFVRLDAFARALGIRPSQQTSSDVLELNITADHHITVDVAQHTYVDQGQHYTLRETEAFKNDDKIYVHESLLHRLFDNVSFTIDQALGRINLPEPEKPPSVLAAQAQQTDKADVAPPPTAAPRTPVIIDDLASEQQAAQQKKEVAPAPPEARDVLHVDQQTDGTAAPKSEGKEDTSGEPLVLQPRLKKHGPSGEFIEALDFAPRVFLPLNDLLQYFEFPIKFERDNNKASGYFFVPENDFSIDLDAKALHIAGKRMDLSPQDVRRFNGQIYISTDALAGWFGITCEIDRKQGSIHFETDRMFPKEEQEERQKRWGRLLRLTQGQEDTNYPALQNEYALLGYPSLDVNLNSTYSQQGKQNTASSKSTSLISNYNIQGAQELGSLTGQFYAQGSTTTKTLDNFRFQAGRTDPSGNLLGALHATNFAVGDVTSPSLSFVTANSLGRGATITNRNEATSENFDVRSFNGNSVPGYEVELYRNNVLLSFQTVDANGRYSFKDVPILYGENTFRLVFYGPQGQREERVETVSATSALLKEGQFEYTFGALQRGFSLLPTVSHSTSNINAPDGKQYVGGFRYGLTSNYSFGAALAETLLADGPHRYLTTSSGSSLFGVLSETSFARDMTSGGWASGMSVLGGFSDISLRGRYRRFNNFMSESVNSQDTPRTSEASLDANSQVYLPLLQEFSVGLGALREAFVNTDFTPRTTYDFRLSKSLWGLSFTNDIHYIMDTEHRVQDVFGVQTRLWDINFRATGLYDLKPQQQFRTASVMADYKLDDRLSAQTQIERDMSSRQTALNQSVNWDFDTFRLSLNNRVNTQRAYAVGLNVLFSLNHNDVTNRWHMQPGQTTGGGAIAGRVFVDENDNGKFDEGEKLVTDATVRVNRAAVSLNDDGYFASPVTPYQKSVVEVSLANLSDPLLSPKTKGYLVTTRPGDTVIADFPLVHTTIIDGTTYFLESNGNKRELGNIVLELQSASGTPLRRLLSEVDGYYSFDKVPSGDYWISVPDEVLDSLNATLKAKIHVVFTEVNEFMTGNDIVLEQKIKLNGPPAFETQTPPQPSDPAIPLPAPPTLPQLGREEVSTKKQGDEEPKDEPDTKLDEISSERVKASS